MQTVISFIKKTGIGIGILFIGIFLGSLGSKPTNSTYSQQEMLQVEATTKPIEEVMTPILTQKIDPTIVLPIKKVTATNIPIATQKPTVAPSPTFIPTNTPAPLKEASMNTQKVSSYSCNCAKTCGSMSCDEAYFQLNQCGCNERDGDNDGVPCESICR